MRSEKPFITKSTETGICQQRHMVTGEHSLNGSFFHCSLKPSQPSRGQEAASFRDSVLCVWRHMQTWRPRSLLRTCCFRLGSSLTHRRPIPVSLGLLCHPRSAVVAPGSPPQTRPRSHPPILLHSGLSHSTPSLSWGPHAALDTTVPHAANTPTRPPQKK